MREKKRSGMITNETAEKVLIYASSVEKNQQILLRQILAEKYEKSLSKPFLLATTLAILIFAYLASLSIGVTSQPLPLAPFPEAQLKS